MNALATVADWENPFAEVDTIIQTPEQAEFWLNFFNALRDGVQIPPDEWATDDELRRMVHCSDEYDFIQLIHDAAQDPACVNRSVCLIDLWAVRTRLEWGLA